MREWLLVIAALGSALAAWYGALSADKSASLAKESQEGVQKMVRINTFERALDYSRKYGSPDAAIELFSLPNDEAERLNSIWSRERSRQ